MALQPIAAREPSETYARINAAISVLNALVTAINDKANIAALSEQVGRISALIDDVATKASSADVQAIQSALQAAVRALQDQIDTRASVEALTAGLRAAAGDRDALQKQIVDNATSALKALSEKAGVADVQVIAKQLRDAVFDLQTQILREAQVSAFGLATKASSNDVQALNTIQSSTARDLQKQILRALARLDGVETGKVSRDDLVALAQAVATQRLAYLRRAGRPGDDPTAFVLCASMADVQRGPNLPAVPEALIAQTDDGAVVRLASAGIIAARWGYALEPGRILGLRTVIRRRTDTADPAGNGVRFGVAYLDQAGGLLLPKSFDVVTDLLRLRASDGRVEIATTVARGPGKDVLIRAPYGARFAVPFVQAFGTDGLPDVEVLDGEDATRLLVQAPVSQDIVARVGALEAGDLPARLGAVESALQNPASLTFATLGDARAAEIPTSISTLTLRGRSAPGDAHGASYKRVSRVQANAGPSGASFQSADGASWLRVDGGVHDADLASDATNFTPPVMGADARHFRGKLGEVAASPYDFQSRVVAGDWAPAISAAASAAAAAFRRMRLDGVYATRSPVELPGNLHLTGKCYLLGRATAPQDCMVRITGGNLHVDGSIEANAGYSTLYDQAYLLTGDQIQHLRLKGLNAVGAQLAYCLGTRDKPSALISESNVEFGHTYGCPGVMQIISVEAYVSIVAPIYSADSYGGNAAWDALPKFGLKVVGGRASVKGGHLECTAATNGFLVLGEPLAAPGKGLVWPVIEIDGAVTETGLPLARMHNPRGLTGPNDTNRRGSISIKGITGAHSQDREAFIQGDADFEGDIFFAADNRVWVAVPGFLRSKPNVEVLNPNAHVYVSPGAFGQEAGFQRWLDGTRGGTLHFPLCQIARAFGLVGQSFEAGQRSTLLFKTPDNTTGAYQRFLGCYDAATGRFTIPNGGLDDIEVVARLAVQPQPGGTQGALSGRLHLFEGSTLVDETGVVNGYGTLIYRRGSLPGGTVLTAQFTPDADCLGHAIPGICALTVEASK